MKKTIISTAEQFQSKYNFPTITNDQFQQKNLSGIFMTLEDIEDEDGMNIFAAQNFIFLNRGIVGRPNLPSQVYFFNNRIELYYRLNGQKHRDGDYASAIYSCKNITMNGNLEYTVDDVPMEKIWYYKNMIHNPDGFAIEYNVDWNHPRPKEHCLYNIPRDAKYFENNPERMRALKERDMDRALLKSKEDLINKVLKL